MWHDKRVALLYRQPRECDRHHCCAQCRRLKVSERRLLHGHDQSTPLAPLRRNVKRRRWCGMGRKTTAHAQRIFGWREAQFPAQTMKVSKIPSLSTVIVRREEAFSDTIKSLLSYGRPFQRDFGVSFVDVRITLIVEDVMSSKFLGCQLSSDQPTLHLNWNDDHQARSRATISFKAGSERSSDNNSWNHAPWGAKPLRVFKWGYSDHDSGHSLVCQKQPEPVNFHTTFFYWNAEDPPFKLQVWLSEQWKSNLRPLRCLLTQRFSNWR